MSREDDLQLPAPLPHKDRIHPAMHQEVMRTVADIVAVVIRKAGQILSEEASDMSSNRSEDWNSQLMYVKTPEKNKILRDRVNAPPGTDSSNVDGTEDWTGELMTIPTPKAYKDRVAAVDVKWAQPAPPRLMLPKQITQTQRITNPFAMTSAGGDGSQTIKIETTIKIGPESTGMHPATGAHEQSTLRGIMRGPGSGSKRPFLGHKERERTSTIHRKILTDLGSHTKSEERYFRPSPESQAPSSDVRDQSIHTRQQDATARTPAKMLYIPPHARSKSLDGADISPFSISSPKIPPSPSTLPISNLKVESPSSDFNQMWSTPSDSGISSLKASSEGREYHFSRRRQDRLPNLPPRLRRAYASHYQISPETTWSSTKSLRPDWKVRFKGRCRNYKAKYVDTHCHLDFLFHREKFSGSFQDFMECHEDTFPDNFEACVAVFCEPHTFLSDGGLWREVCSEPNVWLTMGCHPKSATDFTPYAEDEMVKCILHDKFVAVGEIGLDYSGRFGQHAEIQMRVFARQLGLAIGTGKPLVIHCRDAEDDCFNIMTKFVPKDYKIHRHCFKGSYESARRWLEYFPRLFIGLTPVVTYKSATDVRDLAVKIPLNRLLLETDAPYFVPSCATRSEMSFSHPGMAVTVAEEVAWLRSIPVNDVLVACRENTRSMYGI